MKSRRTRRFRDCYAALEPQFKKQADEAYKLWAENPFHPSLHFKHIEELGPDVWSVRVGRGYRAVGTFVASDVILWQWIGSHADYDKLA